MTVHLVVAMDVEAKPLVRHYEMKRVEGAHPFPLYQGDQVTLAVVGVGKLAAASGTTYAFLHWGGLRDQAWLNVGVAGHGELATGQGVLAHKITDSGTDKSWYPPLLFNHSSPTASVLTVERIERRFQGSWVYEMEAAGFCWAAGRFSTAELIHCYKIISDNRSSSVDDLSLEHIEGFMEEGLQEIDGLVTGLGELAREWTHLQADPNGLQEILEAWRFTFTEKHQLRRLLTRLQVLAPEEPLWDARLRSLEGARAREVLELLEERLAALPGRL